MNRADMRVLWIVFFFFKLLSKAEFPVKLYHKKHCQTQPLRSAREHFDRICPTFRPHGGDPVRSSSCQIPLWVKTAIYWLVPISSLCDRDVHSERPGYLFGYLSYVNSPLWVMAQQLLFPLLCTRDGGIKNNRLLSQFWSLQDESQIVSSPWWH